MKEQRYGLLDDVLDYLYDLRGEWGWKKDEPRAGNMAEYDSLCTVIADMEKLLDREPNK